MSETRPGETTDTLEYITLRAEVPGPSTGKPMAQVEFAAISHPGKVRTNNEDHYLISRMGRTFTALETNMPGGSFPSEVHELAYAMVVADGMGGMAAGEKASQLAIRTGVELVLNSPLWATRVDNESSRMLIAQMKEYFRQVDSAVIGEARSDRHLRGMGTTLTVAYIVDTDVFIVHVGDSRAYRCHNGDLEQLTHDHTMAQGLADAGAIRPEDVHRHSKRHVLTNFVGGPASGVEPEIKTVKLLDGDYLLLCSDGLTEMVKDEQIAQVLRNGPSVQSAAKALIDLALEGGGRDNVTVLLARFVVPKPV